MDKYSELKIYSLQGDALTWNEQAILSQSVLTANRRELIAAEFSRIEKYSHKGDLISFEAVIKYLNDR